MERFSKQQDQSDESKFEKLINSGIKDDKRIIIDTFKGLTTEELDSRLISSIIENEDTTKNDHYKQLVNQYKLKSSLC